MKKLSLSFRPRPTIRIDFRSSQCAIGGFRCWRDHKSQWSIEEESKSIIQHAAHTRLWLCGDNGCVDSHNALRGKCIQVVISRLGFWGPDHRWRWSSNVFRKWNSIKHEPSFHSSASFPSLFSGRQIAGMSPIQISNALHKGTVEARPPRLAALIRHCGGAPARVV